MLSPLCLILLVRLGGYTVNLWAFYFYKLTGKLTATLQLQEFILRNMTVISSTTNVWPSPHSLNRKSATSSVRMYIDGAPVSSRSHTHPSHSQTSRLLTSSLSLGVPVPCTTHWHPVYVRRVDPSDLVFSLSSHRHSRIRLLFRFHFIRYNKPSIWKIPRTKIRHYGQIYVDKTETIIFLPVTLYTSFLTRYSLEESVGLIPNPPQWGLLFPSICLHGLSYPYLTSLTLVEHLHFLVHL